MKGTPTAGPGNNADNEHRTLNNEHRTSNEDTSNSPSPNLLPRGEGMRGGNVRNSNSPSPYPLPGGEGMGGREETEVAPLAGLNGLSPRGGREGGIWAGAHAGELLRVP